MLSFVESDPLDPAVMTLMATKFTPEVLLSAPRRSAAAPNCTGKKAVFMVSSYSFDKHSKTTQIRILDVKTGQSTLLFENAAYSEPTWIEEDKILFLKSGEKGCTSLMLGEVSETASTPKEIECFNGSISNLKLKRLSDSKVAIAVSAPTTPKGHMYNPESDKKTYSSGKVYTSLYVRHWDSYVSENTSAIWYGCLKLHKHTYTLSGLVNALAGTKLQSPVPPFGGAGDFDISSHGIAFVSRDPSLSPALYTKSEVYFVSLKTFTESDPPEPQAIETPGLQGYAASPVFSPNGAGLAFTKMRDIQYESDKTRLMLVPDVTVAKLGPAEEFYATDDGEGGWDARPEGITWSADANTLYVTAEQSGRGMLWKLPSSPRYAASVGPPECLVSEGSVSEVRRLGDEGSGKLLLSSSSLVDNSYYSVLEPNVKTLEMVSSNSKSGRTFGLSKSQCDEIWFQGAGDYQVHALVMKPSDFDKHKKYPLAFLIHGGPQGAWMDSWSTRWNPAVFAEQGYIAVCPNPTGSTGYGMALQNGIQNEWGGRPYLDLEKCFDYISEKMPYVDTDRAVALGASYGGYMINWIQGQPLGRKFKALVCHDGVFSTMDQYSSEELFFPIHDFGGTFWENREGYEKWDPARYLAEWATPMLIIHNELDYRLPVTEGIAMFNAAQSRGVESRFLTFPDENHWVLKPENSIVWHREVLNWINKYAGIRDSGLVESTGGLAVS